MSSQSRIIFDKNFDDIERLISLHDDIGGDKAGRRYGLEVLNKSAIVLITAFWESYCEDLASEAVDHLIKFVNDSASLPENLKKKLQSKSKQLITN